MGENKHDLNVGNRSLVIGINIASLLPKLSSRAILLTLLPLTKLLLYLTSGLGLL